MRLKGPKRKTGGDVNTGPKLSSWSKKTHIFIKQLAFTNPLSDRKPEKKWLYCQVLQFLRVPSSPWSVSSYNTLILSVKIIMFKSKYTLIYLVMSHKDLNCAKATFIKLKLGVICKNSVFFYSRAQTKSHTCARSLLEH